MRDFNKTNGPRVSGRRRRLPRLALLAFLLVGALAFPSLGHADALDDLVRTVAAQPAPAAAPHTRRHRSGKRIKSPRKRRPVTRERSRETGYASRSPLQGLHLTAEQRGSGRVQIIDASEPSLAAGDLPRIERKRL
jgi:hypothetical protein